MRGLEWTTLSATPALAGHRRGGTEGVDRDMLWAAWRSALEGGGSAKALVVVFEDLHGQRQPESLRSRHAARGDARSV